MKTINLINFLKKEIKNIKYTIIDTIIEYSKVSYIKIIKQQIFFLLHPLEHFKKVFLLSDNCIYPNEIKPKSITHELYSRKNYNQFLHRDSELFNMSHKCYVSVKIERSTKRLNIITESTVRRIESRKYA